MRRIARKWFVIAGLAMALVALAGGRAAHVWGGGPQNADIAYCPSNTCVSITGASSTLPLYPGGSAPTLPVTFNNLTSGPIYVDQLTVQFTNNWQSNSSGSCDASNFQITDPSVPGARTTLTGNTTTLTFPRETIAANASWEDDITLTMLDTNKDQDACQGQPLALAYSTPAEYTVPTTSTLAVTTNSGADTATLTATVAPDIQPAPAGRAPSSSDGTVQFLQCSGGSCTPVPGATSASTTPGTWSATIPAGNVGSYNYEAQFQSADQTTFLGSTSSIVTTTLTGCVSAQTAGATTIIKTGTTYTGNYTVGNGASLWLDGGTITGNVTVAGSGAFAATGGTIGGNVQSSGGPIAMAGTTVSGNVQSTNGGLSLGPATTIKGNAADQGGGPFCSQGTSPTQGQVQVRGNVQVQSLTSATTASICSTTVGNNLIWQTNASPSLVGSCGSNTILGNLQVQNNSGKVTIGASGSGNATSGNTIVQGNTGGGTLTGNNSGGNCLLSGNKPGVVGSANTAKGASNQCNTGAGGA